MIVRWTRLTKNTCHKKPSVRPLMENDGDGPEFIHPNLEEQAEGADL